MQVRRVVTGFDDAGRSRVVRDESAPRTHDFVHIPGFSNTVVWAVADNSAPTGVPADITTTLTSLMPGDGASALTIVQFPPSAVFENVDDAKAAQEQARELPGLAETFDPERPGFHTTRTIDYQIVLSGELCLGLESGEETLLKQGDVVIQNGTAHAWTNRTDQPALLAAVSIGLAERAADQLETNKAVVQKAMELLLDPSTAEQAREYLSDEYVQHNPDIASGPDAVIAFAQSETAIRAKQEMRRSPDPAVLIAEGDMVMQMISRELADPDNPGETYRSHWFELFRVEDGRLAEHWDAALKTPGGRR